LLDFEREIAMIALKCEIEYTFNGIAGFLYQSAKDQICWAGYKVSSMINIVMEIGRVMYMEEKSYNNLKLEKQPMSSFSISQALKMAFGDGTNG